MSSGSCSKLAAEQRRVGVGVGVDQARHDDEAGAVDHLVVALAAAHGVGRADVGQAVAIDDHVAGGEHSVLRIHREHGRVANQQSAHRLSPAAECHPRLRYGRRGRNCLAASRPV